MSLGPTRTEKRLRAASREVAEAFPPAAAHAELWTYSGPVDVESAVVQLLKPLDVQVDFRSIPALTTRLAHQVLHHDYGINDVDEACDDGERLGFLLASSERIIVLTNPARGKASERFTEAHEAGHIALEFLPRYRARRQQDLFSAPQREFRELHSDAAENLHRFEDGDADNPASLRVQNSLEAAAREARLREQRANSFAIELLAPLQLVQEMCRSGRPGLESKLAARFGISLTAAEYRVRDVLALSASSSLTLKRSI